MPKRVLLLHLPLQILLQEIHLQINFQLSLNSRDTPLTPFN